MPPTPVTRPAAGSAEMASSEVAIKKTPRHSTRIDFTAIAALLFVCRAGYVTGSIDESPFDLAKCTPLGRSILVRGKGCAHDSIQGLFVSTSLFCLDAGADKRKGIVMTDRSERPPSAFRLNLEQQKNR